MNVIKSHPSLRIICIILIFTFISLDISWAYLPDNNCQNQNLAIWSGFQREFGQSMLSAEGPIVASVLDTADYSFGCPEKDIKPLPLKHAKREIETRFNKLLKADGITILGIVPVEKVKKETLPKKLKKSLDKIGFKGALPGEGVVFILYQRGDEKLLIQVAKKGEVSPQSLPGYEWTVSDKYVVKVVPQDYEGGTSRTSASGASTVADLHEPVIGRIKAAIANPDVKRSLKKDEMRILIDMLRQVEEGNGLSQPQLKKAKIILGWVENKEQFAEADEIRRVAASIIGDDSVSRFATYKEYVSLRNCSEEMGRSMPPHRYAEIDNAIKSVKHRYESWASGKYSIDNLPREARFLINFVNNHTYFFDRDVSQERFDIFIEKAIDPGTMRVIDSERKGFIKRIDRALREKGMALQAGLLIENTERAFEDAERLLAFQVANLSEVTEESIEALVAQRRASASGKSATVDLVDQMRKIIKADDALIRLEWKKNIGWLRIFVRYYDKHGYLSLRQEKVAAEIIESYNKSIRPKHESIVGRIRAAMANPGVKDSLKEDEKRTLIAMLRQVDEGKGLSRSQLNEARMILRRVEDKEQFAEADELRRVAASIIGNDSAARFATYKEYVSLHNCSKEIGRTMPPYRYAEIDNTIKKINSRYESWTSGNYSVDNLPREARFLINFVNNYTHFSDRDVSQERFDIFIEKATDPRTKKVIKSVRERFIKRIDRAPREKWMVLQVGLLIGNTERAFEAVEKLVAFQIANSHEIREKLKLLLEEKKAEELKPRQARKEAIEEIRQLWSEGYLPYATWAFENKRRLWDKVISRSVFGSWQLALEAAGIPTEFRKFEREEKGATAGNAKQRKEWVDKKIKALHSDGENLGLANIKTEHPNLLIIGIKAYGSWPAAVKKNTGLTVTFPTLPDVTEESIEALVAQRRASASGKPVNPFRIFDEASYRGNTVIDDKTVIVGTGGGDCAGLNDFIANLALNLNEKGYKVLGIKNCYDGMVNDNWQELLVELTPKTAEAMKGLPSTVVGSCRRKLSEEDIKKIIERFRRAAGIVITGGNDHIKEAKRISDESQKAGLPIVTVGVPKSVDNDFRTAMLGFKSATLLARRIAARASVNPAQGNGKTTALFEVMGRKSGSLTLEASKGCPYPHAVIIPEKKVRIDDIIKAANSGIRNFFVSEAFSISESDTKLSELLERYPALNARYDKSKESPDKDAHGNPKLTGASLFVVGILEHFCGLHIERTDLTYQLRGASPLSDEFEEEAFDSVLGKRFAKEAADLIIRKNSGLALTYPTYDSASKHGIEPKDAHEVYKPKDLKHVPNRILARLGVLGIKNYPMPLTGISAPTAREDILSREEEVRAIFYGINISTLAHKYGSCVELREPSEVIVSACGRNQPGLEGLSNDLKTIIEATEESVLILIPERYASFKEIADRINEIYGKFGHVNVAISKDFMLDKNDELLQKILKGDAILREKFGSEGIDIGDNKVRFESGVSNFIIGLFKELGINNTRITDLGYAFKGLKSTSSLDILKDEPYLAAQGVVIGGLTKVETSAYAKASTDKRASVPRQSASGQASGRATELFGIVEAAANDTRTDAAAEIRENLKQSEADSIVAGIITLARRAKKENQKLILGVATDWIPDYNDKKSFQYQAANRLVKKITDLPDILRSMGLDNVEVVIEEDSRVLAEGLVVRADASQTKYSNVIAIASQEEVTKEEGNVFAPLTAGKDKALLAGIDPSDLIKACERDRGLLGNQLDVDIMKILFLTLEVACGKEPPEYYWITYDKVNRVLLLKLPPAKPIKYEDLRKMRERDIEALVKA